MVPIIEHGTTHGTSLHVTDHNVSRINNVPMGKSIYGQSKIVCQSVSQQLDSGKGRQWSHTNVTAIVLLHLQIPDLSCLKTLDQSLFNYYYSQLRYDLLQNRISEINYQKQDHKSRVLGYSVNDMYRKMIEDNVTLDDLRRDIDKYIPRKINREYSLFLFNKAHKEIFDKLSSIRNRDHDLK